jgi:hypothetical protein
MKHATPPGTTALTLADQARVVASLQAALAGPRRTTAVTLIETHISFVLVAGDTAYKIKKAVNLGFVDFTTLALRRFYCDEELRLNRRLAPALYLEVVPITGSPEQPVLGGHGPAIDWAVKMRAFAQDGLWDRLATRSALGPADIDALVDVLVAFHDSAAVASPADGYGQGPKVRAPMLDTLQALRPLCPALHERAELDALTQWEMQAFEALDGRFDERVRERRVRECHGDLHLGNVTRIDGQTTVFDCLEFNAELRWTDVMNDVGFMAMDLHGHGLPRLAHRFVNGIVEGSGDVAGLHVLRYYMVYRALVRAKVAALRVAQLGTHALPSERRMAAGARRRYLDVALACSRPATPVLIVTHGCSGSGKTLLTQSLLELIGAIRVRADVERKRLFGLPPLARSDPALREKLYSSAATEVTHARLRETAALALANGHSVILDATFMALEQRELARALAGQLGVRFVIVDFQARADTLRQRVQRRARRADDASEAGLAVLEDQLAHAQPLQPQELPAVFAFDAEPRYDEAGMDARWAPLLQKLGWPVPRP